MSKSKIALIAALAGMSIASPAFAQSRSSEGYVHPYHYEEGRQKMGSWYGHEHAPGNSGEELPER
jgi:hypothetical protein